MCNCSCSAGCIEGTVLCHLPWPWPHLLCLSVSISVHQITLLSAFADSARPGARKTCVVQVADVLAFSMCAQSSPQYPLSLWLVLCCFVNDEQATPVCLWCGPSRQRPVTTPTPPSNWGPLCFSHTHSPEPYMLAVLPHIAWLGCGSVRTVGIVFAAFTSAVTRTE